MDRQNHETDPDGRGLLTLALAATAAISGAAFGRVFEGSSVAARLVLLGAFAVALGAVLERRHLALSLGASALALLVAIGVVVLPGTMFLGVVPTSATIEALVEALGNLGRHATEQATPAPAFPSLVGACVIAVWSAAYASHALATRARSPVLSLVPPATLLAFAEVVVEDGPRPVYAAAFLLAAIGVLFTAGVRHSRGWGPMLPRRRYGSLRLAASSTGRSAQRLGMAVTAITLLVPGLLPGYDDEPLLDLDAAGDRIAISPLVDIRPNLLRDPAIELFRVDAERPSYWRLLSLDRYSGRFWSSTDPRASDGIGVVGGAALGAGRGLGGRTLEQRFHIRALGGPWLPAAFQPTAVNVPERPIVFDPDGSHLVDPEGLLQGFSYEVRSETLAPTPEELDRPIDFRSSGVPDRYVQLPGDLPPEVHEIAERITAGAETPYRQALAIQNFLRTFAYDEKAPAGHGVDDLLHFLRIRRGYCEQFAGTMAVLLRSLGYPSRVVVGFLPGERGPDGIWRVTTDEAHSWVEMFYPGYGWLAFEPTPTRSDPVGAPYQNASIGIVGTQGSTPGEVGSSVPGGPGQRLSAQLQAVERVLGLRPASSAPAADEGGTTWPWWVTAALALAILAAAGVLILPLLRGGLRTLRLRRAASSADRVLVAYDVFGLRAAEVGLGRLRGETPHEYRDRLTAQVTFSDGHLERLTELAAHTLYAGYEPTAAEGRQAALDARALRADVRRHVGWLRSWAGAVRPART